MVWRDNQLPDAFFANPVNDVVRRGIYLAVRFGPAATVFAMALNPFCNGVNCRNNPAFVLVMTLNTILDTNQNDATRNIAKNRFQEFFRPANPQAGLPVSCGVDGVCLSTAHSYNGAGDNDSNHYSVIGPFPLNDLGTTQFNAVMNDLIALGVPADRINFNFVEQDGRLHPV